MVLGLRKRSVVTQNKETEGRPIVGSVGSWIVGKTDVIRGIAHVEPAILGVRLGRLGSDSNCISMLEAHTKMRASFSFHPSVGDPSLGFQSILLDQLYPEQLGGINLHFQGSGPPHICTKQVSSEAIILVRSQRLGN